MPIYEYHCSDCNTDFECLVLGKERPHCPACKSQQIGKLMSACGFVDASKLAAIHQLLRYSAAYRPAQRPVARHAVRR